MAIQTFSPTPKIWFRYIDDTFTVLRSEHINRLLTHTNSVVNAIQFICDLKSEEGELAMLDYRIKQTQEGETTVYRKPTHSNSYLDFQSCHPISVKVGLVKCSSDGPKKFTSRSENLRQEIRHIKNTLRLNSYLPAFLNKFMRNRKKNIYSGSSGSINTGVINNNLTTNGNNADRVKREFKASASLPYKEGTSEASRRILNKADWD
ncbi:unnamed protein product [Heterobilharzia americana]|nr:unnamed protein product [Heterobilharzia americana]